MITIFATPKPFIGHHKVIQENAIRSWKRLVPSCEVILMGSDPGVAEAARQFGCRHITEITCNEFGTPLINSMFDAAQKTASHAIMCYANCDIMFTNVVMEAVNLLSDRRKYLLVGQRHNVDINFKWDFNCPNWERNLSEYIDAKGVLNPPGGMDYFIFPKGQYKDMPDLVVGRAYWDNWMIYHTKRLLIPIIDGTGAVFAVHQNHDYSHCPGGLKAAYVDGTEVKVNLSHIDGGNILLTIEDAEWVLENGKLSLAVDRLRRHLVHLPLVFPWLKGPITLLRSLNKAVHLSSFAFSTCNRLFMNRKR